MGRYRLAVLATATLAAGCTGESSTDPFDGPESAVVSSVSDGDTLVLAGGRRVRLVQIDAPERDECFHDASTRALRRLAPPGSRVLLRADPLLDDRDDFGRLLRYVHVGSTNVNVRLVADGASVPYFFRGDRGVHADRLLTAARGCAA